MALEKTIDQKMQFAKILPRKQRLIKACNSMNEDAGDSIIYGVLSMDLSWLSMP